MAVTDIATRTYDHGFRLGPIVRSPLDTDFYKLLMLQTIRHLQTSKDLVGVAVPHGLVGTMNLEPIGAEDGACGIKVLERHLAGIDHCLEKVTDTSLRSRRTPETRPYLTSMVTPSPVDSTSLQRNEATGAEL
jgi:hypothetical protein